MNSCATRCSTCPPPTCSSACTFSSSSWRSPGPVSLRKRGRRQSLCRLPRACFGHQRAAAPDLQVQNPSVMPERETGGDLEPSLDSRKHMNTQRCVPLTARPNETLNPVDVPLVVKSTGDAGEPAGILEEEEDPEFLPLTFTVRLDRLHRSETGTPLAEQDKVNTRGARGNVPCLRSAEPLCEVQGLDPVEESESALTEYRDKSFLPIST
ncbi:uncharacterized protein LOC125338653 [Perognathus longimembris pacificus]|uniref:uncharacterized protein LOC125338653 n=1 Tax=Perognathus longimembris pacificus TaxID=214514 RepID=UPI0020193C9E|nr:uncharacterized protein LOC125338653 [Perognathus longimembris pacificus]